MPHKFEMFLSEVPEAEKEWMKEGFNYGVTGDPRPLT
ncbi:MAG: hypothetical protein JWP08_1921, partial [Bryobacterales bacterium]|nr:hypothetical protein [Bryobacterales bacterium]